MSALGSCCTPACPSPAPVNIPGSAGTQGDDGTNGVNAFAVVGVAFVVPAVAATVQITFTTSIAWMVVGQTVIIGQGSVGLANPGPATFTVTSIDSATQATFTKVAASGDVLPGATIDALAITSPAGVPGTTGVGDVEFTSPTNPTGTANTTGVMMGLAAALTPTTSARAVIMITGMLGNGAIGDGASVQIRYGSGAAPANGAALTGTTLGVLKNMVASTAAGKQGVALCAVVTGLTLGTAYWIDVGLKAVTGNTATLYDVDVVAIEL